MPHLLVIRLRWLSRGHRRVSKREWRASNDMRIFACSSFGVHCPKKWLDTWIPSKRGWPLRDLWHPTKAEVTTWILDYNYGWIPDPISWIPDSKAAVFRFHRPKLPGFRIPGLPYMGRLLSIHFSLRRQPAKFVGFDFSTRRPLWVSCPSHDFALIWSDFSWFVISLKWIEIQSFVFSQVINVKIDRRGRALCTYISRQFSTLLKGIWE